MNQTENRGRIFWRIVSPLLAYYAVNLIVSLVFSIIAVLNVLQGQDPDTITDMDQLMAQSVQYLAQHTSEAAVLTALLAIPVMLLFCRKDRNRALMGGTVKTYRKIDRIYYPLLILLGGAVCLLLNSLVMLSGLAKVFSDELNQYSQMVYQNQILIEIIGIGILSPITEELLFRRLIFSRFEEYYGTMSALIFSSFIFAMTHGNTIQGIYAIIVGLILGYVYYRYRSLLAPILLHVSANIVSVIVSETDILTNIYASDTGMLIVILVSAVAVILCFYVIQYDVMAAEVQTEEPGTGKV